MSNLVTWRRQESKVLLEQFNGVTVTIGDAMDESSIQKVKGMVQRLKRANLTYSLHFSFWSAWKDALRPSPLSGEKKWKDNKELTTWVTVMLSSKLVSWEWRESSSSPGFRPCIISLHILQKFSLESVITSEVYRIKFTWTIRQIFTGSDSNKFLNCIDDD